jgi:hypothetical protein
MAVAQENLANREKGRPVDPDLDRSRNQLPGELKVEGGLSVDPLFPAERDVVRARRAHERVASAELVG